MCIFKSFREVNSTARVSRALALCQGSMSLAGRTMWEPEVGRLRAEEAWRETAWCLALLVMVVGGLGTMPARARVTGV